MRIALPTGLKDIFARSKPVKVNVRISYRS